MKAEYINPFITSLVNAFSTMVGLTVERTGLCLKDGNQPTHEISGVIGLSGTAIGTVVVSLSEQLAIKAASAMLMMECNELNAEVTDAVGEIANMVAGAAKAELHDFDLSVSLPSVITGRGHTVNFPSDVTPIIVTFDSEWGPLSVEVGLIAKEAMAST